MKPRFFDFSFWLRVRGYGFSLSTERPTFSQRAGYGFHIYLLGVKFAVLKP